LASNAYREIAEAVENGVDLGRLVANEVAVVALEIAVSKGRVYKQATTKQSRGVEHTSCREFPSIPER
jgi:glutamine synthetase type III